MGMSEKIDWNETAQTLDELCADILLLELLFQAQEEKAPSLHVYTEGIPALAMSRLLDYGKQHLFDLTQLLKVGTG